MKWLFRIILGLVAVLLIAGIIGFFFIDTLARSAIEFHSGRALDVGTTLDRASIKFVDGRIDLYDFDIANPEGFDATPRFILLRHGRVDMSFLDLPRRNVEIERIVLEGIEVNLEHTGLDSNHGTILDNLKTFQGEHDPDPYRKYLVREVVLRDITVNVSVILVGGEATRVDLEIPEIVLRDVGTDDNGLSIGGIIDVVTTSLLAAILHQGADVLPNAVLEGLGTGLNAIGDAGSFGMTIAGEAFTGIGELLDSVLEGLGDVFRDDDE
jgi:hypothetical protein